MKKLQNSQVGKKFSSNEFLVHRLAERDEIVMMTSIGP